MSENNEEYLNQNGNNIMPNNNNNNKEEPKNEQKELEEKVNKLKNSSSQAKIIDELPKNKIYEIKNVKTVYRLVYVFKNEDGFINVKPDTKIINVIKRISKKINTPPEKFYIKYNENTLTETDNDLTVKQYFDFPKNKSRPILYIKMKSLNNANANTNNNYLSNSYDAINKSNLYGKSSYINKVKITNYPSMVNINVSANDDIYNIVNAFFKEVKINSDFYVERKEQEKKYYSQQVIEEEEDNLALNDNTIIIYYVSFPTPDIAFDFKRYLTILKLVNPTFKDIKLELVIGHKKSNKKIKKLIIEEPTKNTLMGIYSNLEASNPLEKNKEVIAKIRNNYINSQMHKINNINIYRYGYLNSASPYSTPYEEVIKEKHENRKKWLNPKGFISSVNKYSGVNL